MQIFFSYGHDRHSEVVNRLAEEINKRSDGAVQVWIDSHEIHRDSHWRERITDGIIKSDSVIAFLSAYSQREESVCLDELSIALVSKHGLIRTILLEKPGDAFKPSSRVSEYQWGDMSDYPEVRDKGEEAFSDYIDQEADRIIALVNSDEIKQYDSEIRALRRSFRMPDMDTWTKFDTLINQELIGREWLFERIQKWEEDPNGSHVLLLCGKPGAGKSMFSAHLQMRDSAVVAAFPCDCRHSEYSTTQSIILQISYRLALRLPDYRRWVLELLSNPSYDLGGDRLYEDLILQPLSKINIDGKRATMIIVVDALDEMENDSLADFISRSADSLKKYVRFLVTSRKISAIVERFSRFTQIDLDEEEDANRADLATYYESRLGEHLAGIPEKEEFVCQLIQHSEGVFTYAECVTNNILDDIKQGNFSIRDYALPNGIDDLFRDTMDRSFNRPGALYTKKDYMDMWRTPLGMILASPEPLPLSSLRALMNWKDVDMKTFRRPLSSLLTETECTLTLFHRSFGEWLERTDTEYAVSRADGISMLAQACFEIYDGFQDEMDEYMLLYTTRFLRESRDRAHKKLYRRISRDYAYTDRLFDRAEVLLNNYAFSRSMAFLSEFMTLFDNAAPEDDKGKASSKRELAIFMIGCLYEFTDRYTEALRSYDEALKIAFELKERFPQTPKYLHSYFIILKTIAGTHKVRRDFVRALEYYEKAVLFCQELKDQNPENPNYICDYSNSLCNIAGIYKVQEDLIRALGCYEEALAIFRELKDRYPKKQEYLHDYSRTLSNIAEIHETRIDLGRALVYYEETLAICRKLKEMYPENQEYLCDYSNSLCNIAGIYKVQEDLIRALEYNEEALSIFRELKDRCPENQKYLAEYSHTLNNIAEIHKARKDLDCALECYEEVLSIWKERKERYPESTDHQRWYSGSLNHVAEIYRAWNKLDHALKYHLEELAISRKLKERYPENSTHLNMYSAALELVAFIYREQKDLNHALEYYEEALTFFRELKDRYPENQEYLHDYSRTLNNIAEIHEARKDLDRALEYYEEALAICWKLKERYPENPNYLRNYFRSLEHIAEIYGASKDLDRALEYCKDALAIIWKLKDQYPENLDYLCDYSRSLTNVAMIYSDRGDLNHALAYYKKSLVIYRSLKERYPENLQYFDDTVIALVTCWRVSGENHYLQEALEIARQHPERSFCSKILQIFGIN